MLRFNLLNKKKDDGKNDKSAALRDIAQRDIISALSLNKSGTLCMVGGRQLLKIYKL